MNIFTKSIKTIPFQEKLLFLIVFIVFILLPTNNSSLDAYHYAAEVKYNQELFLPHHLLYNVFIYLIYQPLRSLGIDVLLFSKIINATFSILGLYVLFQILKQLNIVQKERILYVFIVGFSYVFWRYGTENETYIIPISFSLLASYFYLKYIKNPKSIFIFLCGLSAAVACLFHQAHFFWWIGLSIGLIPHIKKLKPIFLYTLSAVIMPLTYILVLVIVKDQEMSIQNLSLFIFHDFYSGVAKNEFGWQNFFFIVLNSIRTFFEVHPVIVLLIKKNFVFIIPIFSMLFLLFQILKTLLQKKLILKRSEVNTSFVTTHLMILLMQLLFALYAVGNIEFMVVIPFLMVLSFLVRYKINFKVLSLFALTLFIWNFSYAIYPNNQYNYYNDKVLINFIVEHPNDIFLVKNADVLNKYYYKTGIDNYKNIVLADQIKTQEEFQKLLATSKSIYTDAIDKPSVLNRSKVVSQDSFKVNFESYKKDEILQYKGLYGNSTIYEIRINELIPH